MYKSSIVPGSIPSIKQNKTNPKSHLYQLDEVCGAQASNSSNREAERAGLLHMQAQPGLHSGFRTVRTTQTELV